MGRQSFAYLLQKYLSGHATADEKLVVEEWYALLEEVPKDLPTQEWKALEKRLWSKLKEKAWEETPNLPRVIPFWQRRSFQASVAAAVALLMLAIGYIKYVNPSKSELTKRVAQEQAKGMELVANTTSKAMKIALEDGSKVWLDPESELYFPKHFSNRAREVNLVGNAYFEVAHKPESPFLVKTGRIVTKVLGTSFWVKSNQNNPRVEVSVKTGKVAVYEAVTEKENQSNKKGNGVVLTPNQRVTFFEESSLFVTDLVENPVVVSNNSTAKTYDFRFDDATLSVVLNYLGEAYNVDIETDKQLLGECPLTANLNGKTLYAQLEIICAAIEGSYEVKGTTILISGKGCH